MWKKKVPRKPITRKAKKRIKMQTKSAEILHNEIAATEA
jgi:hypothetical protein